VLFSDGDRVKTGQIHALSPVEGSEDHEVEVFGETQYYKTHVIAKIREPGHASVPVAREYVNQAAICIQVCWNHSGLF